MEENSVVKQLLRVPVIIAALGYFVDIYDLLLFGIVRIPSLKDLGVVGADLSTVGASILNWQMTGLLLGGILWGVMGDKRGRLSVLFGSILTYSLANIACGFVQDITMYKVLRLIAGIGLAGELGAGITLVSEIIPTKYRALGTSLVAGVGLLGAVVAYFVVEIFAWRTAYFIGGGMGLSLLLLRVGVVESSMFKDIKVHEGLQKGNFFALFTNRDYFLRYIKCIGIGVPTWFVIGILATFSNEFGEAHNTDVSIVPGLSIMWCYVGLSLGDLASGVLSHMLQSRKQAILIMMSFTLLIAVLYISGVTSSANVVYLFVGLMGFGIGYWAMFVTISAEQFGTNMRATVTTSVPNMVRGTVVLMTTSYNALKGSLTVPQAAMVVGFVCFALSYVAVFTISETHGKNLDFTEK